VTGAADIGRFREVLARRLGWQFTDRDAGQLGVLLAERAAENGLEPAAYLDRLAGWPSADEFTELVERLSITETYFFRHGEQFQALRAEALPSRVAARATQRVLRMLSVGCSSGEEAYTMAIVARQVQPDPEWIVNVLGVDANPAMLARAEAGRFPEWSLRETPEAVRYRWFRAADGGYRVMDDARRLVQFRRGNVADPGDPLWEPEQFDVIFCRNLLMYLTPAVAASLVERMTGALVPGGYLFLGHTDTLGPAPAGLELLHTDEAFYYRRVAPPAARRTPPARPARARKAARLDPEEARNRALVLLRDERFAEALAVLGDLPGGVLRGVLLCQVGRIAEATEAARRLIAENGLDADAHQLLGLCLEGASAAAEAVGQYGLAAYLDPGFALARLRLGQLARRRGDDRAAAGELERALDLLPAEDEERILLFGGGFGRFALAMLCRTELDACGARR
jgi:chemotaxis protein methyltransferase CheR